MRTAVLMTVDQTKNGVHYPMLVEARHGGPRLEKLANEAYAVLLL